MLKVAAAMLALFVVVVAVVAKSFEWRKLTTNLFNSLSLYIRTEEVRILKRGRRSRAAIGSNDRALLSFVIATRDWPKKSEAGRRVLPTFLDSGPERDEVR